MFKNNQAKFLATLNEVFRYLIIIFSAFCIFINIVYVYLLMKTDYSSYASNFIFDIVFLLIVLVFSNFKDNSITTRPTYIYLILAILNCYTFYSYVTFNASLMGVVSYQVAIGALSDGNNFLYGVAINFSSLVYTGFAMSFLICLVLYFRMILIGQYEYYLSFGVADAEKKSIIKTYNEVLNNNKFLFYSLFVYLVAYVGFGAIIDQITFKTYGYDIDIACMVYGVVALVISIIILISSKKIEDIKTKSLIFAVFFGIFFVSSIILIILSSGTIISIDILYYALAIMIASFLGFMLSLHIFFLDYLRHKHFN